MTRDWTEDDIAALVDGSIDDAETAERLRRIVDTDAAAKAYAERLQSNNQLLRDAFDAPMRADPPEALRAAVAPPDTVVPLRARTQRRAGWAPSALAAGAALLIGVGVGVRFLAPEAPSDRLTLGYATAADPVGIALEALPSGTLSDDGVRPMLSFRTDAGQVCREFEILAGKPAHLEIGVACRTEDGSWDTRILVAAPIVPVGPDGIAPASGPGADALGAMLDAIGAGPALTADDERRLLEKGWRD